MNLRVDAKDKSHEKATIEWPLKPISIRSIRGRFSVSEESNPAEIPLRDAVVELLNLYTGRVIESSRTDINGDFQFSARNPGVYALRLTLPKKDEAGSETTDFAILLDPAASQDSISEMKVVQTECNGIELSQRSEADGHWVEF